MSRRNAVYAKHHQERFGVEKRGKNVSGEKDFAGFAPKRRRNFTKPVILV